MTEKRKSGGQPGPRGPYKPPMSILPAYTFPTEQVAQVRLHGGDWLRTVVARALEKSDAFKNK